MHLPIDGTKAPFKPKYIDEETPSFARWIVFGFHEAGSGKPYAEQLVDVTDPSGSDIFIRVTGAQAERIVAARNEFCDKILEIMAEF